VTWKNKDEQIEKTLILVVKRYNEEPIVIILDELPADDEDNCWWLNPELYEVIYVLDSSNDTFNSVSNHITALINRRKRIIIVIIKWAARGLDAACAIAALVICFARPETLAA
jgi:hypothetical protein